MDAEKAAGRRAPILASMPQESVDWKDYSYVLEQAEPWEQIEHPENFDWALIRNVPLTAFPEATPEQIKNVDDPDERQGHRDRLKEITKVLKNGGDVWPVIVDAASGAIVDGWHRLAAIRSLGRRTVDVLVS